MALYADPLSFFGSLGLSMEMMRVVRLVVDTSIHSKGRSVEQVIAYMMDNIDDPKIGMHRHEFEGVTTCSDGTVGES